MNVKQFFVLAATASLACGAAEQRPFTNTQEETIPFTSKEDALASWKLPPGFKAQLFASEPDIQQPIGMNWDARGRLWIAENYTYAESPRNFDTTQRDRIIILEDTDQDGRMDKRTVFWDKAEKLTSVAVGFGGVFALCAPNLVFIPDKNGDDIPDGEPEVLLDGFEAVGVRHNIVNGLKWGPDGWLYGRHGILSTSLVGKPGASAAERQKLNCSMWRWHPVTRQFEVIFEGTTNPWGHDWDEHGQLFMINTVIGHLWHVVPGSFTKRMYGEHFNPHLYELIDQTADHVHWDTRERWDDIRKGVTASTLELGGGHAHSGFMIYLGDNWPAEYRNHAYALNFHGRRINRDTIERSGAAYTAKHRPEVATVGDPWFRGIDLTYGPDGAVYVLDWSDIGECHDNDGIHRTSGRIYKLSYGEAAKHEAGDLSKLSNTDLVRFQSHENEWFARMAGQLLHERAAAGHGMAEAHDMLRAMFSAEALIPRKLRALWRLHTTGGASEEFLRAQLRHANEHVRSWAVLLLVDQKTPSAELMKAFAQLAGTERSGLVLSHLASALRKAPLETRWELATAIGRHAEFASDPTMPLLLWYATEPAVTANPRAAVDFVRHVQMPRLRNFVARRLTSELDAKPGPVNALVELLPNLPAAAQVDVLNGMRLALRGVRQASPPSAWAGVSERLAKAQSAEGSRLLRDLGLVFGDGRAIAELKQIIASPSNDVATRRQALEALVQARVEGLLPLLQPLLRDAEVGPDAVRALGVLGAAETPELLVKEFTNFRSQTARTEAVNALASRAATAPVLLAALQSGDIPKQQVTAYQLQQLRTLNDPAVDEGIAKVWPELPARTADKREQIARLTASLTPEKLKRGNASRGREIYTISCGACHKLYGKGGEVGPDLTGADRKNLAYILDNVIDPSGMVADSFRASTVTMKDGRTLNGVGGANTDRTMVLQTATEKMTLDKRDIESISNTTLSLMPEGLFDAMEERQILDLMAYLMSAEPPGE